MIKTNSKIGKTYLIEQFVSGNKVVVRELNKTEVNNYYKRKLF